MQDNPTPRNPVTQEFEQCVCQYVATCFHAATEHLLTVGLSIWLKFQFGYSECHYIVCCASFQVNTLYCSVRVLEK